MPTVKAFSIFILFNLILTLSAKATIVEPDSSLTTAPDINNKRLILLGTGFTAGYAAMLISLDKAWYKENERTSFHFFNDNKEWMQMDKAGHLWTSFHESRAGIDLLRWAGIPDKKAVIYGGLLGLVMQTPVEIFDGYQSEYGASWGDQLANTVGSASVIVQELTWNEIRIMPKFSGHTTRYAAERPNVLGNNLSERLLKDYNGQTYWLSVNVSAFLKEESKYPKWLNIAMGYGADEIVYNHEAANIAQGFKAHRQYYLSPDLNLMHFKGKNKLLKTALYVLSILKLPAPTLEYNNKDGFKTHLLYF
ncbi:DUF2279 domain-containing protein [Pontibacter silvestris]|uniref:DUF2279 domain-containing protein n=1 Tax=Pontibacter silvestris TaxID=2305183 RepID=A0ABW4WW38_9BACT|nr:DUF2279 domain-containing protein [Pontibacter silvestris]MCC9137443.1 YfiM family protein [Pontibacter silvestris]